MMPMRDTSSYRATHFWEKSHSAVAADDVNLGYGVRHVGGGESDREAAALYRLRELNAERILRKATLPANPGIFELGSGGGYWVEFCRLFRPSLFVGSDLSATAVQRLRSTYQSGRFVCLEDSTAGWREIKQQGPYDMCLCIDVLYHIVDDSIWQNSLANLCQNCKVSGWLLIADYFYEQPREMPATSHVKHRPMQTYLDVLDQFGFRVTQIQPIFYFLNRIVSGPWKDHSNLTGVVLRGLIANRLGLAILTALDSVITRFVRPTDPRCKTRFLLAQRVEEQ